MIDVDVTRHTDAKLRAEVAEIDYWTAMPTRGCDVLEEHHRSMLRHREQLTRETTRRGLALPLFEQAGREGEG